MKMNTKNLVKLSTSLGIDEKTGDNYLNIRAHHTVKGENPFLCDNIKLNGAPIKGRGFTFNIFDVLTDDESGLTYKYTTNSNPDDKFDFIFPQILTFRGSVQISETVAIPSALKEMSLKPSNTYLNLIMYDFGTHILHNLLEYTDLNAYEIRSVKERYPYNYIPVITGMERIYTNSGYIEIETYHDGEIIEQGEHGLQIISNPTYIISVEHPYVKVDETSYDPEPEKFREITIDTSKSILEPVKILEDLTKDMIIW